METYQIVFAEPIVTGEEEPWRRFLQELEGSRTEEYEDLKRRMGVRRVRVWLQRTARGGELTIVHLEVEKPREIVKRFIAADGPFDRWVKARLEEFHGLDFSAPRSRRSVSELVLGTDREPYLEEER